jgi:uncharacterized protein
MSSYALITGASKGIGKAMAYRLAKLKYNLLLIARSDKELRELSEILSSAFGIKVSYLSIDLSEKHAAQKIHDWTTENDFGVSILINNAGYAQFGTFTELSLQDQLQMIQVNNLAVVELTHLFLPSLIKNSKGYILNVASTAAYQAVPKMALYAASKAFMVTFTRGLRYELKRNGISVTCLSPGPVDTNFIERAGMNSIKSTAAKFEMTPEVVAKIAIEGMFKGKSEIVPGFLNIISVLSTRFLPKIALEKIAAGIYGFK